MSDESKPPMDWEQRIDRAKRVAKQDDLDLLDRLDYHAIGGDTAAGEAHDRIFELLVDLESANFIVTQQEQVIAITESVEAELSVALATVAKLESYCSYVSDLKESNAALEARVEALTTAAQAAVDELQDFGAEDGWGPADCGFDSINALARVLAREGTE